MGEHRGAIAPRVRYRDHQANGPAYALSHRRSLQLSCSELSLEVEQRALHLNANHSRRAIQHHVDCPPIRCGTHRDFQLNPPDW